ncbi:MULTISPECIES: cupin-like domain-containing protein [unclassified Streptomyces]|uniref:cupin-like domain-containing protein n=1 Tax=unclassified Streptomyces TaxID=2593676 RepID=UPI002254C18E|nr:MULTISPECIES: cupin-like domain-containing protein [unclassified Streptomyces]MCX4526283.1 cupin-like domain-containing protein [Streptomyces sp. NBC_01551]MCX4543153.1 cupin-like domain-containing protein [Streptomyces sp. NBC_01565]
MNDEDRVVNTAHPVSGRESLGGLPVPRISFDEFMAFGREALIRADVPVVITLPQGAQGLGREGVAKRLGDLMVTLFTEPSNKQNSERWTTKEIRLREFFEDERYLSDPGTWNRIVSNFRNSPADVNAILGFDAARLFDYRRPMNAANLWISHKGVFTQSHFDELENFNIALEGRKRFVLAPPGFWEYYPRSLKDGFGDKSQVFDFDDVDWARYPKLASKLAQRRELILEPGQMLYLPLGWWHQAESLDEMNINVNFWLRDPKIFRRPYVLGVALYTAVFRKLKGVYNYEPAEGTS